jgi:hypothetical protein
MCGNLCFDVQTGMSSPCCIELTFLILANTLNKLIHHLYLDICLSFPCVVYVFLLLMRDPLPNARMICNLEETLIH